MTAPGLPTVLQLLLYIAQTQLKIRHPGPRVSQFIGQPHMQKDLKSALEAAKAVGAAAPVTEQVLELVEDTVSNL